MRTGFFSEKIPCLEKVFSTLENFFSRLEKGVSRHGKNFSRRGIFFENNGGSPKCLFCLIMSGGR